MAYTEPTGGSIQQGQLPLTQLGTGVEEPVVKAGWDDATLLKLHKDWKKASFDRRWVWERNWMRNIHYTNNRHWITYSPRDNQWRDVRLAKWYPKPVTPLIWEGVQALRAMFGGVEVGAVVKPSNTDPVNVAVAGYCDELHPVLHDEHDMDGVMNENDYWFIVTGWSCLHTYYDRDVKYGTIRLAYEQCLGCEEVTTEDVIAKNGQACPTCGGVEFAPVMNAQTGETHKVVPKGRGKTDSLSPLEIVFPNTYPRFEDVPYVYRLRWRSKDYYINHPVLKTQIGNYHWAKAPAEQSMQLFRSLPYHTDSGVAPFMSATAEASEEGAVEYECWVRPCDAYPEGLVFRILGDGDNALVLHLEEDEAIPGPLPYTDANGDPVFTFTAEPFEQRGGRVYGTSPLDAAIPIMNQINQLDANNQMIVGRMANPLWLIPKGAGIQKFSGEPGWIAEWNPLTVGGNAKPERIDGASIPSSIFQLRDQKIKDLEEAMGTYDVLKGDRPPNVNAFSAMQLLVERAQSRFGSSFKARGRMYRAWLKFALEIERAFGEETRRVPMLSPAGTWVEKEFKNTDLQGAFSVTVEDGSMQPKTALGMRAAVEHMQQLGIFNPQDPDQAWTALRLFGMTKLSPTLNVHVQAALRKQQAFEAWVLDEQAQQQSLVMAQQDMVKYEQTVAAIQPAAPQLDPATGMDISAPPMMPPPPSPTKNTPLAWKVWFNPSIHLQEFDKWANSDRIVQLLQEKPQMEGLLTAHREEMMAADMAVKAAMVQATAAVRPGAKGVPEAQGAKGSAQAMSNSNAESGGSQNANDNTQSPN